MVFIRSLYKLAINTGNSNDGIYWFYGKLSVVIGYTLIILVQESVQLAEAGPYDYITDVANFTETLQVVLNTIFLY